MCDLFGNKAAASAQQATDAANQQIALMEGQNTAHTDAINQGTTDINNAFAQFTPDYYAGVGQAYENAYDPQLADQYNIAQNQMVANLAGTDQLNGTTGAYDLGQLAKQDETQQANIASSAMDAENSMKSNVSNAENQLYATNAQTADPLQMSSTAQQTAGALVSPQSYPTLSSVFANALGPVAAGAKTGSASLTGYPLYTAPQNAAPMTSSAGNVT